MRHRLQPLETEYLIQARNGKGARDQPGEVRVNDDEHGPRDNRLVGINVAGEWSGRE